MRYQDGKSQKQLFPTINETDERRTAMADKPALVRRQSSRLANAAASDAKKDAAGFKFKRKESFVGTGFTGLTSYLASSSLGWDEKAEEPTRSSTKAVKAKKKEKVDPKWKGQSAIGKKHTAKVRAKAKAKAEEESVDDAD